MTNLKNREYQTLFTASNVHDWKKIEMDAQRLLIWEVRERICFTRKRLFETTSLYLLLRSAPDGWEGQGEGGKERLGICCFLFDMLNAYCVVCMSKSIKQSLEYWVPRPHDMT